MEQNDEKHSMTRQDIEQHLQSALAAATPNVWPKLDLSVPQDKPKSVSGVLRLEKRFRRWGAVAACICLIAAGGMYHYEYLQVVSVIGIDVNPSLRLSLNRREKVLKAEALNLDGEAVLDKELKGKNLESALGQVVDSLVEKGYLKEGLKEQAVLVSVSGKNEKKAEAVKAAAAANVEDAISQNQVSAVVYDQTIQVTKELEELAKTYQVSVGKAGFIEQLVQENETLNQDAAASYERMMSQSMEVIAQEINANAYAVNAKVNVIQVEPAEEKSAALTQKDKNSKEDSGKSSSQTETVRDETESTKKEAGEHNSAPEAGQPENESLADKETLSADKEKDRDTEDEKEPEKKGAEEDTQENTRDKDALDGQVRKETSNGQVKDSDKTDEQESLETKDPPEETGEATSSTAGAETESQEEEDKEDLENKEGLEEEEKDFLVKYGQAVKDELRLDEKDSTDSAQGLPEEKLPDGESTTVKVPENEIPSEKELEDDASTEDSTEEDNSLEKEVKDEVPAGNTTKEEDSLENRPEDSKAAEESPEDKNIGEEIEPPEDDTKRTPESDDAEGEAPKNSDAIEKQPEGNAMPEEQPKDNDAVKEKPENKDADKEQPGGEGAAKEEPENEERAEEASEPAEGETVTAKGPALGESSEGESGHQIIRVKAEKKVWKEPEEPVYASQLLGFSQSRLLCKGPGVFDFIIADPGTRDKDKEGPEDEQEALEPEEVSASEENDEVLFPDTEEDEETMEEWEAEMGEWLHIGPGYLP